jgi:hypothetical protein
MPVAYPRRELLSLADQYERPAAYLEHRERQGDSPIIGEPPEWTFWAMVGLLAFVIVLPALKR